MNASTLPATPRLPSRRLNGYIARRTEECGLRADHNACLPALLRAVERGELEMSPANLTRALSSD